MKMKRFMIVLAALFALTIMSCGPDTWVAPDGLGATYLRNGTQVNITWMGVEGAGWYEVSFRREFESSTTEHILEDRVGTTSYTWTIPSAEEYNSEYLFFKVRAWKHIAASGSGDYYTPARDEKTAWSVEFPLATYQD